MKQTLIKSLALLLLAPAATQAQLLITEVDAAGSGNTNYAADWFEVRNTGSAAVNLTGWKVDDSSASFAAAVALRGITSILPGQVVIFLEGNATGTTDATINANFISSWFGGSAPAGLTLGNYGGSGIGLSTGGDGLNLFDSLGNNMVSITFGANVSSFTFDNTAGLSGTISTLSAVGINGAFASFNPNPTEVGSPGFGSSVVPEPSLLALSALGLSTLVFRQRLVARR